ncbi:MAG: hypothetical protein R3E01_13510 [Pirellulaceae bacterium]
MKTFKDNAGRTWTVAINVDAVKRVRAMLEIDLLEAVEGKLIQQLRDDPILLCDVLYVICKLEADAAEVTDEQFGQGMAGDAIDHATAAFLEELVGFFRKGRRELLAKALDRLNEVETKAMAVANQRLDDPEIEQQILAALNEPASLPPASGDSSGNSPASPASGPSP